MYNEWLGLYTKPIIGMISFMFGILILSYLVAGILKFFKPQKDLSELITRLNTWWFLIGGLALSLLFPLKGAIACWAIVSAIAFYEFFKIVPVRPADTRALWWLFASIPLQYFWIILGWLGLFQVFIPVIVFLAYPIRLIIAGVTQGFLASLGLLHWGTMMSTYTISHIAYLMVLGEKLDAGVGPAGPLLYLLFLTQFNDAAQYIWGKSLGRTKIVPKISPKKTWEGFLGGVATTMVLAWILAPILMPSLTVAFALCAGLIISVSGFFGDIVMSAIKRDIGIKDYSNLLPGHGGILDRIDSLTYAAPVFFYFIYFFVI